jgi:hypothetical protein
MLARAPARATLTSYMHCIAEIGDELTLKGGGTQESGGCFGWKETSHEVVPLDLEQTLNILSDNNNGR